MTQSLFRFEKVRLIDKIHNKVLCSGKQGLRTWLRMKEAFEKADKSLGGLVLQGRVKKGWLACGHNVVSGDIEKGIKLFRRQLVKDIEPTIKEKIEEYSHWNRSCLIIDLGEIAKRILKKHRLFPLYGENQKMMCEILKEWWEALPNYDYKNYFTHVKILFNRQVHLARPMSRSFAGIYLRDGVIDSFHPLLSFGD